MTRELSTFERQSLQAIDASRQRYLLAEKTEDVLWEIGNQITLWSALRGYHYALLGKGANGQAADQLKKEDHPS